jgi:hypothetical protein
MRGALRVRRVRAVVRWRRRYIGKLLSPAPPGKDHEGCADDKKERSQPRHAQISNSVQIEDGRYYRGDEKENSD